MRRLFIDELLVEQACYKVAILFYTLGSTLLTASVRCFASRTGTQSSNAPRISETLVKAEDSVHRHEDDDAVESARQQKFSGQQMFFAHLSKD